jgi:hypothetical protein
MKRFVIAGWLAVLLFALPSGAFANITYNLNSFAADQNGYSLSGSITTDGTIGVLKKMDIVAWTWTVTNGSTTYSASSTDAGAGTVMQGTITTNVSGTQILVPFARTTSVGNGLALTISGVSRLEWINNPVSPNKPSYEAILPGNQIFWNTQNPQMGGFTDWIIAGTLPVPEPSSLALASTAAFAGLGFWVRRRAR